MSSKRVYSLAVCRRAHAFFALLSYGVWAGVSYREVQESAEKDVRKTAHLENQKELKEFKEERNGREITLTFEVDACLSVASSGTRMLKLFRAHSIERINMNQRMTTKRIYFFFKGIAKIVTNSIIKNIVINVPHMILLCSFFIAHPGMALQAIESNDQRPLNKTFQSSATRNQQLEL